MKLQDYLKLNPYSLDKKDKEKYLSGILFHALKYHYKNSELYKKIIDSYGFDINKKVPYDEHPFLPVRLFKEFSLKSLDDKKIIKTMTSSGTSGQEVSKIYLDKETASNQTRALAKIVSDFIGSKRAPMIIIDSASVLKDRNMFSARGAGILGFSLFANKKIFALDENMNIDFENLEAFISEHKESKIFIFGFTFMIFQHFIQQLQKSKKKLDLSQSTLIHGGGWKKLQNNSISSKKFKNLLKDLTNIKNVHDYYGMVEQTGSINMECEYGHLHTSIFSDVIIRNPYNFEKMKFNETGIIQTISVLPKSYPGNSLLTEDEGVIIGEDDCKCGRKGKYFKVLGRLKNAEIRGCSDTYGS